jgi:hypothetical protein
MRLRKKNFNLAKTTKVKKNKENKKFTYDLQSLQSK